jgi:hypothetical protein
MTDDPVPGGYFERYILAPLLIIFSLGMLTLLLWARVSIADLSTTIEMPSFGSLRNGYPRLMTAIAPRLASAEDSDEHARDPDQPACSDSCDDQQQND